MNLQTTISWKDYKSKLWIFSVILSILTLLAGIYILVNSGAIFQTIGVIILGYGIMDVIENINKELGTTVVMATHDKEIVNRMKKRVVVVSNGLIEGDYLKGSYKVNESN